MLIRLAYEQGFLRTKALNVVQHWALEYYLNMVRRVHVEDELAVVEQQTYSMSGYERWQQIYGQKQLEEQMAQQGPDEQAWRPVTDPRELDKWYDSLAAQRGMTEPQAARIFGHAEGEGRRV